MKMKAALRNQEKFNLIPRPPLRLIMTTPVHFIAFGFGSGLAPWAPGTFGTLAALPLFPLLALLPGSAYAAACALLFVFGCWVCGESARLLSVHDYPGLVFDEIVGFLITAAPIVHFLDPYSLPALGALAGAFVLFRAFDILKPWPIGVIDRQVHGGLGVMLDDALAGLMGAAVLALALHFAQS